MEPGQAQCDLLALYLLEEKKTLTFLGEKQRHLEPL